MTNKILFTVELVDEDLNPIDGSTLNRATVPASGDMGLSDINRWVSESIIAARIDSLQLSQLNSGGSSDEKESEKS